MSCCIAQFKDGRNKVVKKTRPGRQSCATDEDQVTKMREMLDSDRRLTCEEIATEVGISLGSKVIISQ